MKKEKIITLILSTVVVVLAIAVVIYAQVVWEQYRRTAVTELPETIDEESEFLPELTPEENLKILNELNIPSEEEFSTEQQTEILNSLSTTGTTTATSS